MPTNTITKIEGQLDFGKIIGLPLSAAVEGAKNSALAYIDFIKKGLDKNGNPIMIEFIRKELNGAGKTVFKKLSMPLLAVVEHPSFTIDEFSDTFTLEISDTFKEDVTTNASGEADAQVGWGILSDKVDVKFSAALTQTRNTDTRAKHEIVIKGSQKGAPEGMMKVIDWLTNSSAFAGTSTAAPPSPPSK